MVTEFEPLPCGHPGIARPCPHCEIERLRALLAEARDLLPTYEDEGGETAGLCEAICIMGADLDRARAALETAERDTAEAREEAECVRDLYVRARGPRFEFPWERSKGADDGE